MARYPWSHGFKFAPGIWLVAAVLLVLLLGAFRWLLLPTYLPVYQTVDEQAQTDILATLSQWQVPYRINGKDGQIEVSEGNLGKARVHLAEAGIPARHNVGFELFDQSDYGMSEFSQRINYQRALEGELARTIMRLREVRDAHIHLSLKKSGLYQAVQEPSKASVVVAARTGTVLSPEQVSGIQQLVASAVEGMKPVQVTVLDDNGQVLSSDAGVLALPGRLQMAAAIEHDLQGRAEAILHRAMPGELANVSVRVQMNFDQVKSVREQPLAEGGAGVPLHEKSQTQNSGSAGPGISSTSTEAANKQSQSSRDVDYVVGKERTDTEHASGTISRISVGVALAMPLSTQAMTSMETLLTAALGLDSARGDQLSLAYFPVASESASASTIVPAVTASPKRELEPATARPVTSGMLMQPAIVWLLALALLIATLLVLAYGLYLRRQQQTAQVARLGADERDQLLLDLQYWLREER